MAEIVESDHIYWGNDCKDHLKRENSIKNARKNIFHNKSKVLLNIFRGINGFQNSISSVPEDHSREVLSGNSLQQPLNCHSVKIGNSTVKMQYKSNADRPISVCSVSTNAEDTEQSYAVNVQNVQRNTAADPGRKENEPFQPVYDSEKVQQRKSNNSTVHHSRKCRLGRKRKWYYFLDDIKDIGEGNTHSDKSRIIVETNTFLTLEELPDSTWNKTSLSYPECEISEEYLELKAASIRMKNRMAPLGCICNTSISPSCVFRCLMKAEKLGTDFSCF